MFRGSTNCIELVKGGYFFAHIMMKFNKDYNSKIVAVIISIVFLFNAALYSCPISEDTLRLHIGTGDNPSTGEPDDTYRRFHDIAAELSGRTREGHDVQGRDETGQFEEKAGKSTAYMRNRESVIFPAFTHESFTADDILLLNDASKFSHTRYYIKIAEEILEMKIDDPQVFKRADQEKWIKSVLIITRSMVLYSQYKEEKQILPEYCLGHSLGFYTALAASGAISFRDALKFTKLLMQEADRIGQELELCSANLVAESGIDLVATVSERFPGVNIRTVYSNNKLSVIGLREDVGKLVESLQNQGALLNAPQVKQTFAVHDRYLIKHSPELVAFIGGLEIRNATTPVISEVSGEVVSGAGRIREELLKNISSPLNFLTVVRTLENSNVRNIIGVRADGLLREAGRVSPGRFGRFNLRYGRVGEKHGTLVKTFEVRVKTHRLSIIENVRTGKVVVQIDDKEIPCKSHILEELLRFDNVFMYAHPEGNPDKLLYQQLIGLNGHANREVSLEQTFPPYSDLEDRARELGITRWRGDLTIYDGYDLQTGELNRSKGHVNNYSVEIFQVLTGKIRMYLENETAEGKVTGYYADLEAGDCILVPPGWYHSTHIIEGPAAVFNIVNREGFTDWKHKRYGAREAAYTFIRDNDEIIPIANPRVGQGKRSKLIELAPTRLPVLDRFEGSFLEFIDRAEPELLERLAQNILTGNLDPDIILSQRTRKGDVIEEYYVPLYPAQENLITRHELEVLAIKPPIVGSAPMTYFDALSNILKLSAPQQDALRELSTIDVIARRAVLQLVDNLEEKVIFSEAIQSRQRLLEDRYGYKIILVYTEGGGVASTYLAIDPQGRAVVVKICDWDGVDGNGMPFLRRQAYRTKWLKENLPVKHRHRVPEVYTIKDSDDYVFYSMQVLEGETLSNILLSQDFDPVSFCGDIDRMYTELCDGLYDSTVPAPADYLNRSYLDRMRYRTGRLQAREGELYTRVVEGRIVVTQEAVYDDISYLFERLVRAKEIIINGIPYPNLPILEGVLERESSLLSRLAPRELRRFSHGDFYFGNSIRTIQGTIAWIDIRGTAEPDEPIDIAYELGKNLHTIFFDLGNVSKALRVNPYAIRFDSEEEKVFIDIQIDASQHDIVSKYLDVRERLLHLIENHLRLGEVAEDGSDWFARTVVAEAAHLISCAPNRLEDDPTGGISILFYTIGTMLLNDFLKGEGIETGTSFSLYDIFNELLIEDRESKKLSEMPPEYEALLAQHGINNVRNLGGMLSLVEIHRSSI